MNRIKQNSDSEKPASPVQDISIIRAVPHGKMAIEEALACYQQWKGKVSFKEDLAHYLMHGCVVSRPSCFAMAKIIDLRPEGDPDMHPAWFIRMAVGDIRELVDCLPGFLPAICFCRRNDGKLRVYSTVKLVKKARAKGK